jgi:hypothetical protein
MRAAGACAGRPACRRSSSTVSSQCSRKRGSPGKPARSRTSRTSERQPTQAISFFMTPLEVTDDRPWLRANSGRPNGQRFAVTSNKLASTQKRCLRPLQRSVRNRSPRRTTCVFSRIRIFAARLSLELRGRQHTRGVDDVALENQFPIPGVTHAHRAFRRRLPPCFQIGKHSGQLPAIDGARIGNDSHSSLDGRSSLRSRGISTLAFECRGVRYKSSWARRVYLSNQR